MGKARSSCNATTHGLLAQDVLLDNENEQQFEERRDAILVDLDPVGELEQVLVERIVVCDWRLRRVRHIETSVFQYEVLDHAVDQAQHLTEKSSNAAVDAMIVRDTSVMDERERAAALRRVEEAKAVRDRETLAVAFIGATRKTDTLTKLSRYEVAIERIRRCTNSNGCRPPARAKR